jgi:hypothetical protein
MSDLDRMDGGPRSAIVICAGIGAQEPRRPEDR